MKTVEKSRGGGMSTVKGCEKEGIKGTTKGCQEEEKKRGTINECEKGRKENGKCGEG